MTNADKIRSMSDKELEQFIYNIYFAGSDRSGFAFCKYNLKLWLNSEYQNSKYNKKNLF